ncbi:MAG TPA: hypothetical protein VMA34_01985 [Terracidiphilus sp.]|nr:hypothetical protein [Terracidiphilus sp.]
MFDLRSPVVSISAIRLTYLPAQAIFKFVRLTDKNKTQIDCGSAQTDRILDKLAREVLDRCLAEESRFRAGVQAGLDAADRGDFVPTSEVWARVEHALKA